MKTLNETYKEVITEKEKPVVNEFYEIKDNITIYTIAVAVRTDPDKDGEYPDIFSKIKLGIYRGLDTPPMHIPPKDVKVKLIDSDGYDGKWANMGE